MLGNVAPHVSDFCDLQNRGAIKYRYASMSGDHSTTFQKKYLGGLSQDRVNRILDSVFGNQLMRLYEAAELESCDLLEHYGFSPKWAKSVRQQIETLEPNTPSKAAETVLNFYENTLANKLQLPPDYTRMSYVHGDLNGANIILDENENIWLIDFFHTRRAHALMDLIKFENDLLYILTPVKTDDDLELSCRLSDRLLYVNDLGAQNLITEDFGTDNLNRCWQTLRHLRSFYSTIIDKDRDPFQLWCGQLRYAIHNLSFEESDQRQKLWALYTAALCIDRIEDRLSQSTSLRLDWLSHESIAPGSLAITLLPGRRDFDRSLDADIDEILGHGISNVVCLATQGELDSFGVRNLLDIYKKQGLDTHHLPILDQEVASPKLTSAAVKWINDALSAGKKVLVHCVGGLGRAGTVAACTLVSNGVAPDAAIAHVREARSQRALETAVQVEFVANYGK